jgi:hypothetical protein
MIFELLWQVQHNLAFSLFFRHILFSFTICFFHQFLQFKEIPKEDVSQDETLSEVIAVLEINDYNSNIENIVEEVYTAVNM